MLKRQNYNESINKLNEIKVITKKDEWQLQRCKQSTQTRCKMTTNTKWALKDTKRQKTQNDHKGMQNYTLKTFKMAWRGGRRLQRCKTTQRMQEKKDTKYHNEMQRDKEFTKTGKITANSNNLKKCKCLQARGPLFASLTVWVSCSFVQRNLLLICARRPDVS